MFIEEKKREKCWVAMIQSCNKAGPAPHQSIIIENIEDVLLYSRATCNLFFLRVKYNIYFMVTHTFRFLIFQKSSSGTFI
jgi:hypothetical protein